MKQICVILYSDGDIFYHETNFETTGKSTRHEFQVAENYF